jgi:hypothetical protein
MRYVCESLIQSERSSLEFGMDSWGGQLRGQLGGQRLDSFGQFGQLRLTSTFSAPYVSRGGFWTAMDSFGQWQRTAIRSSFVFQTDIKRERRQRVSDQSASTSVPTKLWLQYEPLSYCRECGHESIGKGFELALSPGGDAVSVPLTEKIGVRLKLLSIVATTRD